MALPAGALDTPPSVHQRAVQKSKGCITKNLLANTAPKTSQKTLVEFNLAVRKRTLSGKEVFLFYSLFNVDLQ